MWAIYYAAYIQDRKLPLNAYEDLHYRNAGTSFDNYRYGLDNDKRYDFFTSISIYTMSRSRFNGYTLVNPRIQSWNHGNVDYGDGGTMESAMSIQYESVQYSTGSVSNNSPKGFATLHYDVTPSPLSVQGGGTSALFGGGGVLAGVESIFGDVANSKSPLYNSPAGFLGTAIKSINTYKNIKGQYMGVFKIDPNSWRKIKWHLFKDVKNLNKIDITALFQLIIKKKICKIYVKNYKKKWFEIDNIKDYKVLKKSIEN
jgi:hypothetical protein